MKSVYHLGVQNGKQHCADCRKPRVARAIIVKAVAWLAPRQAKVAQKAANEKKERIIAEVWEEIRRKRDRAVSEPPKESEAKRMKCNVTAVLSQQSVNAPVLLKSKKHKWRQEPMTSRIYPEQRRH